MTVQRDRRRFRESGYRLRRARRIFSRITYEAFLNVPDELFDDWIDHMARAALWRGLWSIPTADRVEGFGAGTLRNIRYSLLRGWFRCSPFFGHDMGWYDFRDHHRLVSWRWTKIPDGIRLVG